MVIKIPIAHNEINNMQQLNNVVSNLKIALKNKRNIARIVNHFLVDKRNKTDYAVRYVIKKETEYVGKSILNGRMLGDYLITHYQIRILVSYMYEGTRKNVSIDIYEASFIHDRLLGIDWIALPLRYYVFEQKHSRTVYYAYGRKLIPIKVEAKKER
ncbi:MAG: hypothetical protein ABIK73_06870 [candidate division WOR-3 bacterium]